MLETIATKCTDFLFDKIPGNDLDREIYVYGFMITLSTLCCMLSAVIISLLFRNVLISLIFILVFMTQRIYSGGYHCSSYMRCFLFTNALFICIILASLLIKNFIYLWIINIALAFLSWLFIVIYAPVTNKNNPQSPSRMALNRKKAITISTIMMVITIALGILLRNNNSCTYLLSVAALSSTLVSLLMLVSILTERRKCNV